MRFEKSGDVTPRIHLKLCIMLFPLHWCINSHIKIYLTCTPWAPWAYNVCTSLSSISARALNIMKLKKHKIWVPALRYLTLAMSTPKLHDTNELEAVPPTSPGVTKSCCNLDEVSVLEDRLEGRSCSGVVDEGQITPSWVKALLGKRTNSRREIDAISTRRSVFDDPHLALFYWPTRDYENIHRFDPSARWTHREEEVSDLWPGFMSSDHFLTIIRRSCER